MVSYNNTQSPPPPIVFASGFNYFVLVHRFSVSRCYSTEKGEVELGVGARLVEQLENSADDMENDWHRKGRAGRQAYQGKIPGKLKL